MSRLFRNLYSPEDSGSGGVISTELSEDDIARELAEGVDDSKLEEEVIDIKPKKEEPKKEEKKDDDDDEEIKIVDDEKEEDELEELEKELEGPTEEQLELMTPARRKDILKAYPDLFEKFPYLETAYYRDQRFTEFFPTFKDAEQAAADSKAYAELNQKIDSGNLEDIVSGLKTKGESFNQFIDNLMPLINKVDRGAFEHLVGNTARQIIMSMVEESEASNNDALKTSATIMHQFLFGNSKFVAPSNLSTGKANEPNPQAEALKKREEEFENRRFMEAQNGLVDRVNNVVKATIVKFLDPPTKNNPNGVMTDYVKSAATRDALNKVEQLISKDTRFRNILDRMWQDAAKKNYDKTSIDKIKSACISKARTLLPSVIKAARNDALKGMGKKLNERDSDKGAQSKRSSTPPDKGGKSNESQQSKVPAGMTEEEYLMSDDE